MRFGGFEEEWEVKKLGEITSWSSGGTPPKDNPLFWNGDIPWISASSMRGIVYSDSELKITQAGLKKGSKLSPKGTLLILVRGSMLFNKIPIGIASKDVAFNQDVKSIVVNDYSISEYILNWFMAFEPKILNMVTGTGIGAGKLDIQDLKALEIKIPSLPEQQKIANFFSLINDCIKTQNKIIEEFKLLKSTLIKKVFSQQLKFKDNSGNNYPDWQIKKLENVTKLVNKRNKRNEKLHVYSINNKLGFVPQNEQFEGIDSDDRGYDIKLYKIIDRDTFAYNPARINVGSIGYSGDLENIIISSLYVCFKTNDSVNDKFLFQYLKTDLFNKEVLRNVEGGVRDYLFYENFARIKFNIPCIKEQTKIANFLSSIDAKIDIETQLLQKLEAQKKFLLQNLFV